MSAWACRHGEAAAAGRYQCNSTPQSGRNAGWMLPASPFTTRSPACDDQRIHTRYAAADTLPGMPVCLSTITMRMMCSIPPCGRHAAWCEEHGGRSGYSSVWRFRQPRRSPPRLHLPYVPYARPTCDRCRAELCRQRACFSLCETVPPEGI